MGATQSSRLPPPEPTEPPPSGEFSLTISPELVARLTGRKQAPEGSQAGEEPAQENPILKDLERQRERMLEHERAQFLDTKVRNIIGANPKKTPETDACAAEREACMRCLRETPGDCEDVMRRFSDCVRTPS